MCNCEVFACKNCKMKNIFFGTIFLFVILNGMVQSQDCCIWSEYFDSLECGLRQSGDQLLFTDIRTSNWTFGISNRLQVEYTNVYVTWWRVELDPVSGSWRDLCQKKKKIHEYVFRIGTLFHVLCIIHTSGCTLNHITLLSSQWMLLHMGFRVTTWKFHMVAIYTTMRSIRSILSLITIQNISWINKY